MKSSLFQINWREFGESLILLFISTFLTGIAEAIYAGMFPTGDQLLLSLKAGAIACIGYIIKNLLRNNEGAYFKKDVPVFELKAKVEEQLQELQRKENLKNAS